MPEVRNHLNYFGLTKPQISDAATGIVISDPFICVSEVIYFDWRMAWTYDVFVSTGHFDAGGAPLTDLRRRYWMESEEFDSFGAANAALLSTLQTRFRSIAHPEPSSGAEFEAAHFKTLDYELFINFTDGDDFPMRRLRGDAYHAHIAANADVIGFDAVGTPGLLPVLHGAASAKDPDFFADATLVLPV